MAGLYFLAPLMVLVGYVANCLQRAVGGDHVSYVSVEAFTCWCGTLQCWTSLCQGGNIGEGICSYQPVFLSEICSKMEIE